MTIEDYGNIKEIHEKLTYWREMVDDLKGWQIEAHKDMEQNRVYQKTFPKQGIRFCLKRKKKCEEDRCVFGMCMQGRIKSQILPLVSIDALVKYAEEQLKIAEDNFNNIQIKEKE